jgi:hypothetical protein
MWKVYGMRRRFRNISKINFLARAVPTIIATFHPQILVSWPLGSEPQFQHSRKVFRKVVALF